MQPLYPNRETLARLYQTLFWSVSLDLPASGFALPTAQARGHSVTCAPHGLGFSRPGKGLP